MKKVFRRKKNRCWMVGRVFFCWSMLNIFVFSSSLLLFLIWIKKKKKPPINFDNTGYVLKSAKQRGKNNTCLNITYNYAFFV